MTTNTCPICNGPNPGPRDACSRTCEIDLAFLKGSINDWPDDTDTEEKATTR